MHRGLLHVPTPLLFMFPTNLKNTRTTNTLDHDTTTNTVYDTLPDTLRRRENKPTLFPTLGADTLLDTI